MPLVSIIIACRNEERFISKCLDSLIGQDYPKERIEFLVVDGMSGDKSREIIRNYSEKFPFIELLDNPKKFTNFAFNIGIRESEGEIIMLMGAHADYEKDYISKCVKYLSEYDADNVGGRVIILPQRNSLIARAIAFSLSHHFGSGNAYYKVSSSDEVKLVDTVFGGCYKREVFEKIGLFNENLIRSQDLEFNLRLKKAGGKILLIPEIVAYYHPKFNLKDFFIHNFEDGIWAIYPLKFVKTPFKIRHYIPLIFVGSLIGSLLLSIFFSVFVWLFLFIFGSYFLANIYFSTEIVFREKNLKYLFLMPLAFANRHFGYGLGSLFGAIKLLL